MCPLTNNGTLFPFIQLESDLSLNPKPQTKANQRAGVLKGSFKGILYAVSVALGFRGFGFRFRIFGVYEPTTTRQEVPIYSQAVSEVPWR